ncbi:MAG: hypothetical protein JWR18_720 [Segetibacter sp.]|nr:hypothetical protein [Segetibacter sp.]
MVDCILHINSNRFFQLAFKRDIMSRIKLSININATKEKVWETLWTDSTYRQWTAPFTEGSYAESDWNEGSRIVFLTPSGEGMFSVIERKIPNKQMSFRHLGEIKNGVDEPKDWDEATENYYLEEKNGVTELVVEMGSTEDFEQHLRNTFPKALEILKRICEQ